MLTETTNTWQFSRRYNLTVVGVITALIVPSAFVILKFGHSVKQNVSDLTYGVIVLAALSLILVPLALTHLFDLVRPGTVLIIDRSGLHDRRLTSRPIFWHDMEQVVLYRKGWQVMARIDLKPDGALPGRKYGLSLAYPVFALNRLAAGWQNRPEFQVALGGLSQPEADIIACIERCRPGILRVSL